ncbi:12700_t:CDS:2 [Ambispora leptoticha]|uniref:12700_t:CDS:1 n=1 Tax=Ambispora leptoticha TaxID=144679 RepID=A0A9N9CX10_9GLOM|nr:12700_t:CDS:2 [Ambispora leptoticha]
MANAIFLCLLLFIEGYCWAANHNMLITSHDAVISALKSSQVIPDVLDDFRVSGILKPSYGESKDDDADNPLDVNLGNELTPNDTAKAPKVWFATDEPDSEDQFALVMVDPDAPSRANPTNREFRHWAVGNIPANANLDKATTLTPYYPPTPPAGSGKHRYVFVLFKQPQRDIQYNLPEARSNFNTREFAKNYKLKIITANFFYCENSG